MNILFFLTPKSDVVYLNSDDTLRSALEKMQPYRYTSVPVIDKVKGTYIGTITEGDLLWHITENNQLSLSNADRVRIFNIKRRRDNVPVNINSNMEDLYAKCMTQNFVPVVDDDNCFIGIVTRKDIMQYLVNHQQKEEPAQIEIVMNS